VGRAYILLFGSHPEPHGAEAKSSVESQGDGIPRGVWEVEGLIFGCKASLPRKPAAVGERVKKDRFPSMLGGGGKISTETASGRGKAVQRRAWRKREGGTFFSRRVCPEGLRGYAEERTREIDVTVTEDTFGRQKKGIGLTGNENGYAEMTESSIF